MVPWQYANHASTAWTTTQMFEELPFHVHTPDQVSPAWATTQMFEELPFHVYESDQVGENDDSDDDIPEDAAGEDEDDSDSDFEIDPNHLMPPRKIGDYCDCYAEEQEQCSYEPASFEKDVETCASVEVEDGFDMLFDAQEAKEAIRAL